MPVGNVLVCDTRGDVEHDDTALAVDVVSIAQTAELLLTCCVPDVELDGSEVLPKSISKLCRASEGGQRTVVKPSG